MSIVVMDRLVEKIIDVLKDSAVVTKYTGSGASARIYGSHLSTIQDWVLPAVSIHLMPGTRRMTSAGFIDLIELQIDPWMKSTGANASVWDDMMECHSAIVQALHRTGGWDDVIGLKLISLTMVSKGPIIQDEDGIMHYPSRWQARATI